jgi:hypothetical protein
LKEPLPKLNRKQVKTLSHTQVLELHPFPVLLRIFGSIYPVWEANFLHEKASKLRKVYATSHGAGTAILCSYELNFTEHLRNLLLAHWLTQILAVLLVAASACRPSHLAHSKCCQYNSQLNTPCTCIDRGKRQCKYSTVSSCLIENLHASVQTCVRIPISAQSL